MPRIDPPNSDELMRPQPRGEVELDAAAEWDEDWPADDDGDWSGCAHNTDQEES